MRTEVPLYTSITGRYIKVLNREKCISRNLQYNLTEDVPRLLRSESGGILVSVGVKVPTK